MGNFRIRFRNKVSFYAAFPLLVVSMLLSCNAEAKTGNEPQQNVGERSPSQNFRSYLSAEELEYLSSTGGILNVAIMNYEHSYELGTDEVIHGFDYYYALAFVKALGMEARFRVLDSIGDFFAFNGQFDQTVITDSSRTYTPDIFSQVDVAAGPFAINQWRLRLVDMVPLFPVGVAIVGPKAREVQSYGDLDGRSIAVRRGDFQLEVLREISSEHNIRIYIREYDPVQDDVFALLRQGYADYVLDGTFFLAKGIQDIGDMQVSPLTINVVPVGWMFDSEHVVLQEIFERFVSYSLDAGILQEIWGREMGFDFDFYLQMIGGNT